MSNALYDQEYLKNLLDVVSDDLNDLQKWSVWNGDEKGDEIFQIIDLYNLLKKQMAKKYE